MKKFLFADLIADYSIPFSYEVASTKYIDDIGEWQEAAAEWVAASGALIPLGVRQIEQSGGTLNEADRTLYYTGPLLKTGTRILCNGMIYHVLRVVPYQDYADFNQYTVKYVSAFDEVIS